MNSTTTISNRHRPKRQTTNNNPFNKQSSEEEDQEIEKLYSSIKRRSRARKRDSTPISLDGNLESYNNNGEETNPSGTSTRKRSASENDVSFFPIDDDKQSESSTLFVDAHSRLNSIDSRKKVLIISSRRSVESDDDDDDDDESYSSSPEDSIHADDFHTKTQRTLSNPIPIQQKLNVNNDIEGEPSTLMNDIFSQSAPITNNLNVAAVRISQSNDPNTYFLDENFSPSSSFER